jgi:hypothetical protein
LQTDLEQKEQQIKLLSDRLLVQDHELRELRGLKGRLEQVKQMEKELETLRAKVY